MAWTRPITGYTMYPQMVNEELVQGTLRMQKTHLLVLEEYMKMVQAKQDMHGIMDASADIRETVARIETLEWVLSNPGVALV